MGSEPKKHHFIPQCYLKGFQYGSSKTPKIVVYNKQSMKDYIAAINKTACIKDFHTVKHEKGENKSIVEEILSKYENLFIKRLKKVVNTCCIDRKDKYTLSKMMLMLWYRSPKIAKNYKMFFQKNLEAIAELNFRKNNMGLTGAFKDYFQIVVHNNCYIKNFMSGFNNKKVIGRIYMMNFSLLEAPSNEYFLCSDSPVSFYSQSFDNKIIKNGIFFPLNKSYGLLCSDNDVPLYKKLTTEEVDGFNINTVAYANEYIYSSCKNDAVKLMIKIAKKYSNT